MYSNTSYVKRQHNMSGTTEMRLGYACINTVLDKQGYKVNNSCIAKTVREKGISFVIEKAKKNLENVIRILEWNETNDIRFYRMSSDMFPHLTNPEFKQEGHVYSYPLEQFSEYFRRIGEYAYDYEHRITYHPGHYNQIGTNNKQVFEKTSIDLRYHADVLDLCKLDQNSVMVVHGGGTYGDKDTTKKRWVQQFFELPTNVQERIVIENCERQYSVQDVIDIAKQVRRPVVFDTHHHDCHSLLVEEQQPADVYMDTILDLWKQCDVRPKFHISEQAPTKRIGAHSDYVETIPTYFWKWHNKGHVFDLMIEAKQKEQSVFHLYNKYKLYYL